MTFKLANFPYKKIMDSFICLVSRALESKCPFRNTLSLPQHNLSFSYFVFICMGVCQEKFLEYLYQVQSPGNLNNLYTFKDIQYMLQLI